MEEQRTIRITGLEGKVNLEDLHKGIYLVMGKPECVRVHIVTKDEPSPETFPQVHFWEDQPTAAFWDSFVDVAAGEVIIADAWVAKQTALETFRKAEAQAWKARHKALTQAREVRDKTPMNSTAWKVYDKAEDQAEKDLEKVIAQAEEVYWKAVTPTKKEEDPDV